MNPTEPDTSDRNAEEARLIAAATTDLDQFAPIYERYFPRIYGYCLRRVGSAQEAEDLTSLIFTNALTNLPKFRGGVVAAWLFQIAHHAVINHLKQQQRKDRVAVPLDALSLDLPTGAPPPDEEVITREEHQRLQRVVSELPADQQDLLLLRIVGGLTAEEIGSVVGKRAGAVRVALHRILRQLQVKFEGGEVHHG